MAVLSTAESVPAMAGTGEDSEFRFCTECIVSGTDIDRRKLRDISLRDVEKFRSTHFRGENAAIIITGGFDIDSTPPAMPITAGYSPSCWRKGMNRGTASSTYLSERRPMPSTPSM